MFYGFQNLFYEPGNYWANSNRAAKQFSITDQLFFKSKPGFVSTWARISYRANIVLKNTVCLFVEVPAGGNFAIIWFVFFVDVPAGAFFLKNLVFVRFCYLLKASRICKTVFIGRI